MTIDNENEELLEQTFLRSESRQRELVKQHCGNIEERIQTSRSGSEAHRIADEACKKFDGECESEVIKTFLRQYVQSLLDEYWNACD